MKDETLAEMAKRRLKLARTISKKQIKIIYPNASREEVKLIHSRLKRLKA